MERDRKDRRYGVVFVVLLVVTLIGVSMVLGAAWKSRNLTGEWLGYPLPDYVTTFFGIGLFVAVFGFLACVAFLLLLAAEKTGLRRVLDTPVLPEEHPVARIGKGILRLEKAWGLVLCLFLVAAVVWIAFHDGLTASFLGGTLFLGYVIFLAWRGKRKGELNGEPSRRR